MTPINKAIKEAIKGGYKAEWKLGAVFELKPRPNAEEIGERLMSFDEVFTDPEFWKALGKARGWYKYSEVEIELPTNEESRKQRLIELENNFGVILRIHDHLAIVSPYKKEQKTWREYAHDWFSNRLSGGSDDDWFEKNL